jgi:hypothetical protein
VTSSHDREPRSTGARLINVRFRTLLIGIVVGWAAALLVGCGGNGESGDPSSTSPPPHEATAPSLSPITPSPSASSLTPQPTGEVTLTGEVLEGVEPNCTVLHTDTGDYLVYGPSAEELRIGATVTVRGVVRPDVFTTCQQGTPLEVLEVLD